MRVNTFVYNRDQIRACAECPHVDEVLLESLHFARRGVLSADQVRDLAFEARSNGLKTVLVWDLLMTEDVMRDCVERLRERQLGFFDAIRVSDAGALEWLLEQETVPEIHWSCESGNNNIDALLSWCSYVKGRTGRPLGRILLSLELPERDLCHYCTEVPVPLEYLGAGPIEVFYSRRRLLSSFYSSHACTLISQDMNGRALRAIETVHGTFLYLDRDQFVLNRTERLQSAGLHTLRIDLRDYAWQSDIESFAELAVSRTSSGDGPAWPRRVQSPFFRANHTTRQFEKLKSFRSRIQKSTPIGEVIAAEKEKYIAVQLREDTGLSGPFVIILPTGLELSVENPAFKSIDGVRMLYGSSGNVLLADWIPSLQPGALLFKGCS